uniref:Uncharacterized protein n=1 Tax=Anguilla anguilla TaxID=7936 RepID=A0A0E9UIT7_ANGAN
MATYTQICIAYYNTNFEYVIPSRYMCVFV